MLQAEAACRSVYVLIDSCDEELRGFYTATRLEVPRGYQIGSAGRDSGGITGIFARDLKRIH